MVVHRGGVVPLNLATMGYNSAPEQKIDAYLPAVHLEGAPP